MRSSRLYRRHDTDQSAFRRRRLVTDAPTPLDLRPASMFAATRSTLRTLSASSKVAKHSGVRFISKHVHPPLAFAFDIDGVLIRGSSVIPEAKRAFAILEGDNEFNKKIPYVLMTNGGGVGEADRCRRLTKTLGVEIKPSMLIQAHTILREKAAAYADQNVLILGGKQNQLREVAESYGFKNVWTPLDIKASNPHVWDFYDLTPEEAASSKTFDFASTPISAAFVFHDPRNWALDIQILLDVILSGGVVGQPWTYSSNPHNSPVDLVFCNPDLIWKSDFPVPRLGQGGFREAFQAVFKAVTGQEYRYTQYGKPTKPAYDFARKMLEDRLRALGAHRTAEEGFAAYMIGDIAGANGAGWSSVLVRTGVYEDTHGPPAHKPTHIADHVLDAVQWAMRKELGR
ncbi:HAD-superfamily hydrolase [Peniophora sp. CONT]|nr:HAD-superfamily hydrolase [Peniophora sp. CONT]